MVSPKKKSEISPLVQNHLKKVYLTLCGALLALAAGTFLHIILWNIEDLLTAIAFIGWIGCMASLLFIVPKYQEKKRVGLLMAVSLFQGALLNPLIHLAIQIDPSVVITAMVGTSVVFGCFSGAAILSRRREYLYLSALLSSALFIILLLDIASWFCGAIFKFEMYIGLFVFVGFVVLDTQKIIEKAHRGDLDYVKHALDLLQDFVRLFERIVRIMLKNLCEKNEKKKKRTD